MSFFLRLLGRNGTKEASDLEVVEKRHKTLITQLEKQRTTTIDATINQILAIKEEAASLVNNNSELVPEGVEKK